MIELKIRSLTLELMCKKQNWSLTGISIINNSCNEVGFISNEDTEKNTVEIKLDETYLINVLCE